MKAIFIAAGEGSRLGNLTKDLPKPLVDVNSKSIIERQISLLRKNNINDIVVTTGYKKEKFTFKNIEYVHNPNFREQEQTGKQYPKFLISLTIITVLPLLTFLIGGVSLDFEYPELKQLSKTIYNFKGGIAIIPELMALALALSLYTATFIGENVRAGIEGISRGQKEAAASIGLTPGQTLKLVIMPQALRIIIPPTTNQYLNLTKNSSLAAAIAYPDLVLVFAGTALMQTGRAIEIISITMLSYLSLSISISIFMNWYNKKIAIKEK